MVYRENPSLDRNVGEFLTIFPRIFPSGYLATASASRRHYCVVMKACRGFQWYSYAYLRIPFAADRSTMIVRILLVLFNSWLLVE